MKSVKILLAVLLMTLSSFSAVTIHGGIKGPSMDGSTRSNVVMLFKGDVRYADIPYPTFSCTTQQGISALNGKEYSSDTTKLNYPGVARWRGTVRPVKKGFVFTPEFCTYPDSADSAQAYNPMHVVTHTYVQNYTARDTALPVVKISPLSDIALGSSISINSEALDNSGLIRIVLTYFSSDSGKTFELIDSLGKSLWVDSLKTMQYTPKKAGTACQIKIVASDVELNKGIGYSNIFAISQITQVVPKIMPSNISYPRNASVFDPLGRSIKSNQRLTIKRAVMVNGQERILKIR